MQNQYDRFYAAGLTREVIPSITVRGWPKNRLEAVVVAGGEGERLLDIGCGAGHLLYQFRNKFKNLIGLEYSSHRLALAKINLAELSFTPLLGSAERLTDLAPDSIDQIVSTDTIEHIPDVYQAVGEMYRVLRPAGRLVINTPNVAFIKKRFQLLIGRFPSTFQPNEGISGDILYDGGHLHYFTVRSLRLILKNMALKSKRSPDTDPLEEFIIFGLNS